MLNKQILQKIATLICISSIIFFHIYKIDQLPLGFYLDESSIAINASAIADTGQDEHGVSWPIYFKAFGEYKNPVYIYLTAAIFKIFGVSEFALRLTSALFFLVSAAFFYYLLKALFKNNNEVRYFGLITFGFLPYFFQPSRIAFEVIAQVTWVTAIILGSYKILNCDSVKLDKRKVGVAILLGLLLGTSVYTYSTARLLSPITLLIICICLFDYKPSFLANLRQTKYLPLKLSMIIISAFLVGLIPYLYFINTNPGALTSRFSLLTYLDDPLPIYDKAFLFIKNYLAYWSPYFLVFKGDLNFRHGIHYAGAIYIATYVLGLLSLIVWLVKGYFWQDKFIRFLTLAWFAAPLAAATINDFAVLRSITAGIFWAIAACYGFLYLLSFLKDEFKFSFSISILIFLLLEAILYLSAYFIIYPERSIHGSESYGLKQAYQRAIAYQPNKIWFLADPHASYANLEFVKLLASNDQAVPVELATNPYFQIQTKECVIFTVWNRQLLNFRLTPVLLTNEALEPSKIQKLLGISAKPYITQLACF